MSTRSNNETWIQVLETWCEFADTDATGAMATQTYRPDNITVLEDGSYQIPTEIKVQWTGHSIIDELGKGGMGVVHRAEQQALQRVIALKAPKHPHLNRRFTEEALISGYLSHPNIIAVHNLLHGDNHTIALTMPLIDGVSWDKKLASDYEQSNGTLSNRVLHEHLDHLLKVCQAISYAHHKGILHNDLKLENIMVGEFGDVVVMDWGCATQNPVVDVSLAFHILHPNQVTRPFGSPCYMPPELAQGQGHSMGPWTDTYLIGAMLYEILEGRPPRKGKTLGSVIQQACLGDTDPFEKCTSPALQQICLRALSPNRKDRYSTPDDLEDDIRGYFKAEQSESLLTTVETVLREERSHTYSDSHTSLMTLIEAVSMTLQADQIWPSASAKNLREKACRQLVSRAIEVGDLKLATAYLHHLSNDHDDLRKSLTSQQQKRQLETEAIERNTRLTRLIVAFVMISLTVGGALINSARQEALTQHAIASERLVELTSLSDIQTAQQLTTDLDTLWPLRTSMVPEMERWINTAENLISRKSVHIDHLNTLSTYETEMDPQLLKWELGIISSLLDEMTLLESKWLPNIKARRSFALTLRERSIDDHNARWASAIQGIQEHPMYDGLNMEPQLGLIPLHQDPISGLWEFAHLQSGTPPEIVDGKYVLTPETGIVLTLLPASSFWMGATKDGTRNIDPRSKESEGPVHLVDLGAFFISKYEMTQGQWLRMNENNPAAYPVGTDLKPRPITALHPIEQITWSEATETLFRYDLKLPTEAQWEYAVRGKWTAAEETPSSNSVFWTGNTVASLQGTLNIADMGGRRLGSPESWRFESTLDDGHMVHAPIGSFNGNPFGLHDMLGNVWEWCSDRFGEYTLPTEPGTGKRLAPEDAPNLFRGGGFRASSVHVRSADRYSIYAADYSAYDVGLRPARMIETTSAPIESE